MSDLNTEILISANAEGVEAGVGRAKKSLSSLGDTAQKIGKNGADGMQALGAGADMSARKVESATKNMVGSLQRQIAAMEAGDKTSRKYQETLARMRGVDVAALKPYLDQLDSLQNKTTLAERAQASFNSVMLKGAAVFAAAGAIASYVKIINDGVDALNDLKDATGASIENISALEDVGKRAGASFDVVSTSLIKFNNVLSDAKPGSAAEQAIKALGLSIEDLKRLDPAEALRQTSVALNRFADDGDKARLVQELFGKSVKEVAPFLKDLAESGALVAKVTTEQAEQAEKFNKELFALGKNAQDASRALVGPMVSALNDVIAKFKEGREAGKSFLEIANSRYWSNIRDFYGMTPPAAPSTGGASGSWGDGPDIKPSVGPLPDTKKPKGPTKAELSEYDKLIQKLGVDLPKAAAEAEAAQMGYNKAQAEFLALAGSGVWAKFTNSQRATVAALFENKIASEQSAEAAKTLAKANLDAAASREKYLTSLSAGLDKIQADIAAQIEATERMGLSKEAIAELDAAKLEMLATDLELQAIKAMDRNLDQQTYDALKKQAAAYRELGIAKKGGAAKEAAIDLEKASADAAKKAQEDWERASEQINSTLTDALMRGFESGKDFAKNLRDTVVNMFKTMVLRPVISAVLSPISGALGGVLGGGAGGAGSNPIGMASNAYSMYNAGSQAWTLGSQYMAGTMSGANVLGTAYANATGGGIDALLATNGAYGTAPAGASWMSQLGTAGAAFAAVTGLAAAFGAFRSERSVGGGLSGTFGSGDITGYDLRRESGYLFGGPDYTMVNPAQRIAELEAMRGKGTYLGGGWVGSEVALEQEIERLKVTYKDMLASQGAQSKALQTAYEALRTSAGDMADSLGLGSDAVRAFTTTVGTDVIHPDTGGIGIKLDGLKPEEVQAKIQAALATASNELAQQVIGSWETVTETVRNFAYEGFAFEDGQRLVETAPTVTQKSVYVASEFARDGEKAIDTLTRLATSLTTVNDIWQNLGNTVYEASLAGADAASTMADAFGGLEAMAAATGAYFENFYSAEEQRAAVERQLNEALGKLNLTLPDIDATDARAQYRALTEAQDRNTESGREAYVTLLQLSGAFASVTQAAGRAMDAAGFDRKDRLAAQREQEKQAAEALQKQIEAYADGAEQFNTLRDSLLKAGDAAGLLAAATERAFADPSGRYMNGRYELPRWEEGTTAAGYNYQYGQMQARMRQQLGDEASANALRIENVKDVLGAYSVESMMSEYDTVTGPIKLAIQQGIVDASGDLGFAVRDAVQGAALYAAMADVRGQFTSSGPGLASIAAARATATDASRTSIDPSTGLYRIGGAAVEYGKALDSLQAYMRSGAIDADTFERAVEALGAALPGAAESLGTLEDAIAAVERASFDVGTAGLNSIRYYFGSLSDLTAEFAKAAAEAQEPIAQTTAAIGRLNSAQSAFGDSAAAALEGFGGGGLGGAQVLQNTAVMKDITRAQLIAEAAGIASAAMTTADAAAAAAKLAQSPAFAELTAQGIRDASLLLDGVGQYNAEGFERAFLRISDALAKGNVTDAQYRSLFDVALDMFEGVPEETRTLIDSMARLRDAMSGFADGLLIDEQRTTLSAGATLAEMQRQYAQAFAGAATGDNDAIGKYQQLANTLLDKELYSTQAEYNAAFGSVYGDARQLEAIGINTMANAQGNEMVSELKDMNAKLNKRVEDLEKNLLAALAQIAKNTSETSRGVDRMNTVGMPA